MSHDLTDHDTPASRPTVRRHSALGGRALARLGLGWVAVIALTFAGPLPAAELGTPMLLGALGLIIAVITVCAAGVVVQAEHLSRLLGDPYGTLVLTLSIVVIETMLITAVMLGPGDYTEIARDSITAAGMILLNLLLGLCLLVAGLKNGPMGVNRRAAGMYLALFVVLVAVVFALPTLTGPDGPDGSVGPVGTMLAIAVTLGLYGLFLQQQMGPRAGLFREPGAGGGGSEPIGTLLRRHRRVLLLRTVVLLGTVTPIVMLSDHMAGLLDEGMLRAGAPAALAGVLIAAIVLTPELFTAVRAARSAELQRVMNLGLGALASTLGGTVPLVLILASLTGQRVVFGETPLMLVMWAASLALTAVTFSTGRMRWGNGVAHLALFGVFVAMLFA
ncbi:MAG: calcium:proton antiporter [Brachybacterium sp.]|nr:calcium:proton antiporter [Brachybacterium sp.]